MTNWTEATTDQGRPQCPDCGTTLRISPDYTTCRCTNCEQDYRYKRETRHYVRPVATDGDTPSS